MFFYGDEQRHSGIQTLPFFSLLTVSSGPGCGRCQLSQPLVGGHLVWKVHYNEVRGSSGDK